MAYSIDFIACEGFNTHERLLNNFYHGVHGVSRRKIQRIILKLRDLRGFILPK
jgi:hypothetical protein